MQPRLLIFFVSVIALPAEYFAAARGSWLNADALGCGGAVEADKYRFFTSNNNN